MVVCGSRDSKVSVECGRPTGTGTVHHYGLLDVFNETSINCIINIRNKTKIYEGFVLWQFDFGGREKGRVFFNFRGARRGS